MSIFFRLTGTWPFIIHCHIRTAWNVWGSVVQKIGPSAGDTSIPRDSSAPEVFQALQVVVEQSIKATILHIHTYIYICIYIYTHVNAHLISTYPVRLFQRLRNMSETNQDLVLKSAAVSTIVCFPQMTGTLWIYQQRLVGGPGPPLWKIWSVNWDD